MFYLIKDCEDILSCNVLILFLILIFNFDTSNASDSKHSPSAQSDEFEALSPVIML